jgi:glutamine amidotransferase-like uncharacterized protein
MWSRLASLLLVSTASVFAVSVKDIAIYNDTDDVEWPNGGAWATLVTATSTLIEALGYSWEYIDADDVNNNDLGEYYQLIFFPGGWAGGYNEYINETGDQNIRDFVSEGGAYMGMCAGAFFASDTVHWRENGAVSTLQNVYDYPLDLWPGIADGSINDFQPWTSSVETGCTLLPGARMVDLKVNTAVLPALIPTVNVLYYGGPVFRPPNGKWTNETVIARYDMDGFSADEAAAMILFPYGKGRVFLSAVHPELSLNETCDLYYDNDGSRTFLGQLIAQMLTPEPAAKPQIEMSRLVAFATLLGLTYQIESSADAGETWQAYRQPIQADSFEHIEKIPAIDEDLAFRIQVIE